MATGCQSTAGIQVKHDSTPAAKNEIIDHTFNNAIEVTQVDGTMVGNLYSGTVVVTNTSSSTEEFQYQFTWYDENDRELEIDSHGWSPAIVYGKDQKTLSNVAPNPEAAKFRVSIRDLKATKVFKTNFFGRK
jgi:uncharacterized protein YcfL